MANKELPAGSAPAAKRVRSRFLRPAWIAFAIFAVWFAERLWTFWGPATAIRTAPETTVVNGPFDAKGRGWIDYAEALNERRGSLPPDQNALGPLLEAFGTDIIEEELREVALRHAGALNFDLSKPLLPWPEFEKQWRASREQDALNREEAAPDGPDADDPPKSPPVGTAADDPLKAFEIAAHRPWRNEEFPVLAAYLDSNAAPRSILRRAMGRKKLQVPVVSRSGTLRLSIVDTPVYTRTFDVLRQWRLEAMRHLQAGEPDKAFEVIDAMRRTAGWMGQLREETALMVQSSALKFAFEAEVACLAHLGGRAPSANRPARLADSEKEIEPLAEVVDLDFRFQTLQGIQRGWADGGYGPIRDLAQEWIGTRSGIDVNAALRRVNSDYDRAVAGLRTARTPEELASVDRQISDDWDRDCRDPVGIVTAYLIGSRGRMGSIYAATHGQQTFPIFQRLRAMEQERLTEFLMLRVAYAVIAHKSKTGVLPKRLDELAGEERFGAAADAFGRPLVYSIEGDVFTLSSLGKDGKPDEKPSLEEEPSPEQNRGDDRAIRIDLKVAQ